MANARILVVETVAAPGGLKERLLDLGYDVSAVVSSGEAALANAAESQPDIILMDMPGQEPGQEVNSAERLQQSSGLPVVCLTSETQPSQTAAKPAVGPLEFLPRPYQGRDLREAIEAALQRRAMKSKLEESQEWFFTTLRGIGEAVIASDEDGRITFLNPKAETITGWSHGEACGRPLGEVLRLEGRPIPDSPEGTVGAILRNSIAPGLDTPIRTLVAKDGRKSRVEASASLIREDNGRIMGVVRILRDVTEREQADRLRRASERRYRSLVEKSQDIIFTLSRKGTITSLNPAFERAFGWPAEEWLSIPFSHLLLPEDRDRAWAAFQGVLAGREVPPLEMRARTQSGGEIFLECTSVPADPGSSEDGEDAPGGVWGIARDITRRKRLEERVLQTQKMEAVGRLAGGIAHDFNNLLTAITGYTDFLQQALGKDSPLLHNVDGILSSVDRAANLTRQLLAFSRRQPASPRSLDLNSVVAALISTLGGLVEDDINLNLELDDDLGLILADPGQMEEVLLILINNARDAMPGGGALRITTTRVLAPQDVTGGAQFPPPYVLLTVADTGMGMDEATKAHLFEPFFTTKPIGMGAGLGLSTVYAIVKLGGGDVQVESSPGNGALFRLYFPRLDARPAAQPSPLPQAEIRQGGETILLVEDDEEVRSLLCTILKSDGYAVLEAKDGEQALELAGAHQGGIHLTVTDLHMPKMGGRQLVEKLLSRSPGMKVLFMSGFSREDFPEPEGQALPVCFLEKPFMPKSLVRQIRRILDG